MDRFEKIMSNYPELTLGFEKMPSKLKGLVIGNEITLNSDITETEQIQWLYEELGHFETSVGDIIDYSKLQNAKQEHRARVWGIKRLIAHEIIDEYKSKGADDDYEVADELGIQISYLHEAGRIYHII